MTAILEAAGSKTLEVDGKKVAGKRLLGRLLWDIATTGHATMPDGKALILDPADWVGLVKWIYAHIDGPPKAELDVTSAGERIKGYIGVTPDDWPGPDETA